jgi:NAD(P)-dependent dehydrogenase (short-subunit alcohol dehydrogenase family)
MAIWVVTGASRGIGLELARQLTQRGEPVIATARNPREADELNALEVSVHTLDVTNPASVAAFAASLGDTPVDILINNAGRGGDGPGLSRLDVERLMSYFDVNALGPLRVTQSLLPNLRAGQRRVVAHLSSRLGSIEDNSEGGAYGYRSSKAALNMINRSMSIELGPEGFCCVVLHPGWVRTDMGGARAPLSVEESVAGLLQVLYRLSESDNGQFLSYTGDSLPW